jgi:hypothetical protein
VKNKVAWLGKTAISINTPTAILQLVETMFLADEKQEGADMCITNDLDS